MMPRLASLSIIEATVGNTGGFPVILVPVAALGALAGIFLGSTVISHLVTVFRRAKVRRTPLLAKFIDFLI